ncbi:ring-cleaving dioxygenase [Mucilaginibacter angelicae]|uniref:Ring-cleaving dioxygenase n=1 Tax=Mucilaginibacter angelicae TaxID=869718 RepID=A0ABV6L091_9SPHI
MENKLKGIHHITAIAGDAKSNYDFYTKILGLRFVKKTVNFDDPETYHFYYGDEFGTPGTILTFFPWGKVQAGQSGSGQATAIGYSVAAGSLEFWKQRLSDNNIRLGEFAERFGERYLTLFDPDGLKLELIESQTIDKRKGWETDEIKPENALKGFYNVTITVRKAGPTANILTQIFDYTQRATEGNRYRYATGAIDTANTIDIIEADEKGGFVAGGSVHHVAFRVENEEVLMQYRDKVIAAGLSITEKIDRNYFYSLYFREPGGVLFEIATDNPGFAVDEPVAELGMNLKLPAQYEQYREHLEKVLPKIN